MSEIRKQIEEIKKEAKKARHRNNILWGLVSVLVIGCLVLAAWALLEKKKAEDATQAEEIAKNEAVDARKEAVDARQALDQKIEENREVLWESAAKVNTAASYSFYVSFYGEDENYPQVESAMDNLFKDEGYSQIRDSDGTMYVDVSELKLGTFLKAKQGLNVNTGVLGSPDYPNARDKRNHAIIKGQVVKLLERIEYGDAVWAKIAYTRQ